MLGGRVVFEKFCFDPFFFPAAKNTATQLFIQLVSLILGFCLLIFWLVVFLCSCSLSFSVSRCFSLCLLGVVKTLLLAKTSAILVTNTGNTNENWMLRGGNSTNWSLGSTAGLDTAVLMGVFASSTTTTEIVDAEFDDGTDEILTTNQIVVYGDGGRYNLDSSHVIQTGGVSPLTSSTYGKSRSLWLKLKTPTSSSVATQQQFRLYVVTAAP
jgi:hypothetical protein